MVLLYIPYRQIPKAPFLRPEAIPPVPPAFPWRLAAHLRPGPELLPEAQAPGLPGERPWAQPELRAGEAFGAPPSGPVPEANLQPGAPRLAQWAVPCAPLKYPSLDCADPGFQSALSGFPNPLPKSAPGWQKSPPGPFWRIPKTPVSGAALAPVSQSAIVLPLVQPLLVTEV